ncbi:MAG: hypothetical protein RLZZ303_1629 [Candidatus Hydrogenedentota bacterium]|jgi:hypothetical protein
MERERDITAGRSMAILLLLALLALILRCVGLAGESAWWDEYSSLVHLERPSLWEFLRFNRVHDPATLPLYYSIEYLWSRVAGTSILAMRVPSLLLGVACVPMIYLVGARLFDRRAGLIAASLLATSPIHVFHAQGIRMYVLFALLALVSLHTLLRLRDGGGRWAWASHGAAQLMLSWTHPFALLIPVVQGLSWLAGGRATFGVALRWAALTAAAWAPALIYLSQVRYWSEESTSGWFVLPDAFGLLADLFADDVIAASYQLRIAPEAWHWLPALGPALVSGRLALDAALALGLLGFAGAGAWALRQRRADFALLLLWLLLPAMTLFVASLLFRPMIFPRYTLYSVFALYLLAGAAIARVGVSVPRMASALVMAGLMLFQVGLLHPGPQRTDYGGVARHVTAEGNPETDVVLVEDELWRDVFAFNAGDLEMPIIACGDEALCALAARHYRASSEGAVWLVSQDAYFDPEPNRDLEAALEKQTLTWEHRRFFGIDALDLYRVVGSPESMVDAGVARLIQSKDDSAGQRAAMRTVMGVAAALAKRGRAEAADALAAAYLGEDYREHYLYGVTARSLREAPGDAMPALAAAIETSNLLGLYEERGPLLAAGELVALSRNPLAPAMVPVTLIDIAEKFPALRADAMEALRASTNPPRLFYRVLDLFKQRHAEGADLSVAGELLGVRAGMPVESRHEVSFLLCRTLGELRGSGARDVEARVLLLDALTPLLSDPKAAPADAFFHLTELLKTTSTDTGCGPELDRLFALAEPLSPLTFKVNWALLQRACATGAPLLPLLPAMDALVRGMELFGEGNYAEAERVLTEACVADFGMPHIVLGVTRLAQGDRAGFERHVREGLSMDVDLRTVYGSFFEALFEGDREAARARAEDFRGSDLDNADLLLLLVEQYGAGGQLLGSES